MNFLKSHQIGLVCSDIDGTLIRGQAKLSEAVKRAICTLESSGVSFAFATGRLPYEVEPLMEGIPECTACIAGNGAVIIHGGVVLESHSFSPAPLQSLAERYAAQGITVIFSENGLERPLAITPWALENAALFPGLDSPADSSIWHRPLQRMFFYHPQPGALADCRRSLAAFESQYEICLQNDNSIQISPRGCTKASGVARLAALLNVPQQQILCIGDAQNDISMIRYAGVGVAVQNACAELKACADYISAYAYGDALVKIVDNSQF